MIMLWHMRDAILPCSAHVQDGQWAENGVHSVQITSRSGQGEGAACWVSKN